MKAGFITTKALVFNDTYLLPNQWVRPGVWTLQEVDEYVRNNNWPIPTFTPPTTVQEDFIVAGTYSYVATVPRVSIVAVGAGGGGLEQQGGGGGGGLGYKNNYPLVIGLSYSVVVGACVPGGLGGDSYFGAPTVVRGGGGQRPAGGTFTGDGGGNGGAGGLVLYGGGGGGAGGYAGTGGVGGSGLFPVPGPGGNGAGGGGGGGGTGIQSGPASAPARGVGGAGGGVGIYGQGANGVGGAPSPSPSPGVAGFSGSGGSGGEPVTSIQATWGGLYGGGGGDGGASRPGTYTTKGGDGAVRIIYSSTLTRTYPSTNTGNI